MTKWHRAYMTTAETFASLSTAKRLQVGAIVVKDNRIISIGYNGMPSGWSNECEECCDGGGQIGLGCNHDHCTGPKTKKQVIHAEANAIAKLAGSHESGKNATMFITHAPCIECAKQIYAVGIKAIYYRHEYRSDEGLKFLRDCGVHTFQL